MDRDFEKLFALVEDLEPRAELLMRVNSAVDRAERRHVFVRAVAFTVVAFVAVGALIPAWRELQAEVMQSGFVQFVSLLVSDFGLVATYWKEFSLSILESVPVLGITAVLGSVFTLLISLRFMARDLSKLPRHSPRLRKV